MLLFIDNFDSFTYNLVQAFQVLHTQVRVVRNNAMTTQECLDMTPKQLAIGPGPGTPEKTGISKALIQKLAGTVPILGICLGHQTIGEIYGGRIIRAKEPVHGKPSRIYHNGNGLFSELPQGFDAIRYHSLVIDRAGFPDCLEITAETDEGEIMGIRHRDLPIEGVQFHPESILTESGMELLKNFIHHTT